MVVSSAQALAWIRKGEKNRHYGKTKMNQRSSRSHTIFRMILESRERSDPASGENVDGAILVSHLNLVDLAGSERASQTGAEGARLKEGCNINRSLFTLGQVIKKVTDESQNSDLGPQHVVAFFWGVGVPDNKDLVQEVAKLRRSLDDAEGVSRDTKKDWAVLRSQNIALEEMN
ncbi:centromere-associated protein E-like, partial [Seriola lalandi dorsalis]|uniref:centromere-associated protein E-like n=1 Tax=Seriola lalandi dorsalis TaxID=1841481 RepID=UPI000C6F6859